MNAINEKDDRLLQAAEKGREDVDAQKKLLAEYFQDAGWESQRVVNGMMATKDFYYDHLGQVTMRKWSNGRVVLLGDAGYCPSPFSGMGTTLALNGAHNLAGVTLRHPDHHTAAFAEYEAKMRPIVDRAQKLAPVMPYLMNPETWWAVWVLLTFICIIYRLGLDNLLIGFQRPPANAVPVEEYGFKQLPERAEFVKLTNSG